MIRCLVLLITCILLGACAKKIQTVVTHADPGKFPPPPDYSLSGHWASLPEKRDAADSLPLKSTLRDGQAAARADVFFIYPTIYTGKPQENFPWNADVNNLELNREIQRTTILNQASIFNGSCRVFSPYYRQAHLYAFCTTNTEDGKLALELAYQDVRTAFQFYLTNYNRDRPIVIASHSQGSYHAMRLLKDFFDGKELKKQLVVAYLVGRAIPANTFDTIKPCEGSEDTGVWASWNTFARGYIPETYDRYYTQALSINPLLWNTSETYAPKEKNTGGVGYRFTLFPQLADAQNHKNLLWISKPYIRGRFFLRNKVWHKADMNLFYSNIRENVAMRIDAFLRK